MLYTMHAKLSWFYSSRRRIKNRETVALYQAKVNRIYFPACCPRANFGILIDSKK